MDQQRIGNNAGKIWNALNIDGPLTKYQLNSKTGLSSQEIDAAIGWLAREDKIRRNGEFFQLDKTNMLETISMNADTLLKVLKEFPYSTANLHEVTDMTEVEVHQSIGWLSREGHINLTTDPVVEEILEENQDSIQMLKDEVDFLAKDIENRNQIINQLTRQLTDRQTDYIQQADVIDQMHNQLEEKNAILLVRHQDLQEKCNEITLLRDEMRDLHHDICSRNEIISALSKQLSDKHLEVLDQTHAIEQLQIKANSVVAQPAAPSATTEIQQRVHHVSTIESNMEALKEPTLPFETCLFNKESPALNLQETQEVDSAVIQPRSIDDIHKNVDDAIHEKIQKLKNR